jgi:hypothetical protein
MKAQNLFMMAAVFFLLELNNILKRKSKNPVRNREAYRQSFLFTALLFLGWGFFYALIAKPFFPKWELSACLLFIITLCVLFQIKARISRGFFLLKTKMHPYFRSIFFLSAIVYLGCSFLQYDPRKPYPIEDQFLSTILCGLLFFQIGMIKIAFYENGLMIGIYFIPWKRIAAYRWRPGYDARLIISTRNLFTPYIEFEIEPEQKEEALCTLLENAPQADAGSKEMIDDAEPNQSQKLSKGTFYDWMG